MSLKSMKCGVMWKYSKGMNEYQQQAQQRALARCCRIPAATASTFNRSSHPLRQKFCQIPAPDNGLNNGLEPVVPEFPKQPRYGIDESASPVRTSAKHSGIHTADSNAVSIIWTLVIIVKSQSSVIFFLLQVFQFIFLYSLSGTST